MPVFRSKDGKKTTSLYVDEIKRLHFTRDLLADLALNNPLIAEYDSAHEKLTQVCDLWPMPGPKVKKVEAESPAPDDEPPSYLPRTAASMEAASDPRTA